MHYPEPIARLMDSFMKLPGIGAKTAARLAFFCMDMREEDVLTFANSLISCKRDLRMCSVCGNVTQEDPCEICADTTRDHTKILVVEDEYGADEGIQRALSCASRGVVSDGRDWAG